MLFQLKLYQERCLETLTAYLKRAGEVGASRSFNERDDLPQKYREVPQLPGLPYICIRIPTGGGKTVLAAHSVGVAARDFLRVERCVVLWLAPTNAIVDQTLKALRDRAHPYRQALDKDFGGDVEIMSLTEALYVTRATLDGTAAVIVSTLAAMRVEETDGRKVYESNGALQHHFSGLSEAQLSRLERADGVVSYSLANVLRLRLPLVIMDEAHNARTQLSFDTLKRFGPSGIIEFTATPDQEVSPSNVLYSVSAAELKAEHMVKLPIRMLSREQWKEAVGGAVTKQKQLGELAKTEERATGEYLRPIVLFQAQPKRENQETVTVEVLRKCLIEDFGIPSEEIAEGTGHKWELPDNLLTRDCPILYILTVAALREGWDCPFAYVLCSVSNLSSKGAVEQILGRVLRLPNAKTKQETGLNFAYTYATSQRFVEAARSLEDALVDSGFTRYEARASIEPDPMLFDNDVVGPLFTQTVTEAEFVTMMPGLERLPGGLRDKIKIESPTAGRPNFKIIYTGPPMTRDESAALITVVDPEEDKVAAERLARKTRGQPVYPAALGAELSVPQLAIRVDGQLEIFEDQFRDAPWDIAECDGRLSEAEFSLAGSAGQEAVVDVNEAGKVQIEFLAEMRRQLTFNDLRGPKSESELAEWLDRAIEHPDITQSQSSVFLRRMVDHLVTERGLPLPEVVAARFRLRDLAKAKIEEYRVDALSDSYQRMLLPDAIPLLEVSPDLCFQFPHDQYPANKLYQGAIKFPKHYYEVPGEMNSEEAECAAIIDSLNEVKYWVRNLTRSDFSFWLQTKTDKFYPDFVAQLKDGRFLVVEYKGADRMELPDTKEKRELGEFWEARSKGKCIFLLVGRSSMETLIRNAVR
jgi:type III restriction enzyme